MSHWTTRTLLALGLLLSGSAAAGRTWVVALDGSGDFTLISAACTAAASGDTIRIRPGQYDEPQYSGYNKPWFNVYDKSLTIFGSGADPSSVVITFALGIGSGPATGQVVVQDVTFQGPTGRLGIWARVLDVGDCVFLGTGTGPSAGWGQMPLESYAVESALVHDCLFQGNIAISGGAANVPSAIDIVGHGEVIRDCVFEDNVTDAEDAGALLISAEPEDACLVEGCVFLGNQAPQGAAICGFRTVVRSCTFYGNQGTGCMWCSYLLGFYNQVYNCIVTATKGGNICDDGSMPGIEEYCCDIWGNDFGDPGPPVGMHDCFSLDPLLCDPTNGDVTLHSDSPCVNATGCGVVGAKGIGCGDSPIKVTTWGRLKFSYK